MQTASKSLPDNPLQLKEMLLSERIISAQRGAEIVRLKQQYQHMLEQFRASQQRQFGQSSESSPNQAELFDEAEQTLDELADNSPEKAVAGHIRQSPKRHTARRLTQRSHRSRYSRQ